MITNDRGRQIIQEAESLRLKPYRCPAGIWTVGWGHTDPYGYVEELAKRGGSITKHQAEELLAHDLEESERIVTQAVKVPLNGNQFSALVSFVFNVGPGRKGKKDGFVTLKSGRPSTMLRKLNEGDYAGAAAEFPKWVSAQGVQLPGLVKRRAAEKRLFEEKEFFS